MRVPASSLLSLLLLSAGCVFIDVDGVPSPAPGDGDGSAPEPLSLSFDLTEGDQGFFADIAEYGLEQEDLIAFESGVVELPPELPEERGFVLSSRNVSDDAFMFLARRLGEDDGIEPGVTYRGDVTIRFASNAPSGCAGIGGAPGESVWLKAGLTDARPETAVEEDNVVVDIDKGQQSAGGEEVDVVSDIANGVPCEEALPDPEYVVLTRTGELPATAAEDGALYLVVGIESGFEGTTTAYFLDLEVELEPAFE